MLRHVLLLVLMSLAGWQPVAGQLPGPPSRALNTTDGLVNNAIQAIAQDRQGFLWLGTQDGLSRYDGSTFRTFRADARRPGTLVGNFVRAVAADPVRGGLWVGTGSGLCRYNPRTEQFAPIPTGYPPGTNYFVHAVLADKAGRVWAGTEDGLWCYEPGRRLPEDHRQLGGGDGHADGPRLPVQVGGEVHGQEGPHAVADVGCEKVQPVQRHPAAVRGLL